MVIHPRYITTRCKAKPADRPRCRRPTYHGSNASRRSGVELDSRRTSVWRRGVPVPTFWLRIGRNRLRRRERFARSALSRPRRRRPLAVSSHNVSRHTWRPRLLVFSEQTLSLFATSPLLVVDVHKHVSVKQVSGYLRVFTHCMLHAACSVVVHWSGYVLACIYRPTQSINFLFLYKQI